MSWSWLQSSKKCFIILRYILKMAAKQTLENFTQVTPLKINYLLILWVEFDEINAKYYLGYSSLFLRNYTLWRISVFFVMRTQAYKQRKLSKIAFLQTSLINAILRFYYMNRLTCLWMQISRFVMNSNLLFINLGELTGCC